MNVAYNMDCLDGMNRLDLRGCVRRAGTEGARTVNVAYNADCLAAMRDMPDKG